MTFSRLLFFTRDISFFLPCERWLTDFLLLMLYFYLVMRDVYPLQAGKTLDLEVCIR